MATRPLTLIFALWLTLIFSGLSFAKENEEKKLIDLIHESPQLQQKQYHLLLIHICNYKSSEWSPLKLPAIESRELKTLLLRDYHGFAASRTKVLSDKNATLNGLDTAFRELQRNLKAHDSLVIYISGRDVQIGSKSYWVPYGGTSEDLNSLVSADRLLGWIEQLKSGHTLVIANNCITNDLSKTPDEEQDNTFSLATIAEAKPSGKELKKKKSQRTKAASAFAMDLNLASSHLGNTFSRIVSAKRPSQNAVLATDFINLLHSPPTIHGLSSSDISILLGNPARPSFFTTENGKPHDSAGVFWFIRNDNPDPESPSPFFDINCESNAPDTIFSTGGQKFTGNSIRVSADDWEITASSPEKVEDEYTGLATNLYQTTTINRTFTTQGPHKPVSIQMKKWKNGKVERVYISVPGELGLVGVEPEKARLQKGAGYAVVPRLNQKPKMKTNIAALERMLEELGISPQTATQIKTELDARYRPKYTFKLAKKGYYAEERSLLQRLLNRQKQEEKTDKEVSDHERP